MRRDRAGSGCCCEVPAWGSLPSCRSRIAITEIIKEHHRTAHGVEGADCSRHVVRGGGPMLCFQACASRSPPCPRNKLGKTSPIACVLSLFYSLFIILVLISSRNFTTQYSDFVRHHLCLARLMGQGHESRWPISRLAEVFCSMNDDVSICGTLTAASHQWRQRMKEAHIVWPAVMRVAVSALALFATLMAVFPALRLVIRTFFFDQ